WQVARGGGRRAGGRACRGSRRRRASRSSRAANGRRGREGSSSRSAAPCSRSAHVAERAQPFLVAGREDLGVHRARREARAERAELPPHGGGRAGAGRVLVVEGEEFLAR